MAVALNLVAVAALNFMGTNARAVDAIAGTPATASTHVVSRTLPPKRQGIVQISSCMTKRMGADRAITYYGAMKLCQDKLDRQLADAASRTLLASVTPATP